MRAAAVLACGASLLAAGPAVAQADDGPSLTLEAASDERRRGLSWSDGAPVLRAYAAVPLNGEISLDATAAVLSGSDRHGGADAAIDLRAGYVRQLGGWRLSAEASYHLFPGASNQGYAELGAAAGFILGPASIDLFARYAPDQSAIGGDNLYIATMVAAGIPGTPLTVSGHVGRSSGSADNALRAARLRPGGRYWDHGVALEYRKDRWSAALRYADTSLGKGVAHSGATLILSAGVTF
jgi:hypothetical protein